MDKPIKPKSGEQTVELFEICDGMRMDALLHEYSKWGDARDASIQMYDGYAMVYGKRILAPSEETLKKYEEDMKAYIDWSRQLELNRQEAHVTELKRRLGVEEQRLANMRAQVGKNYLE